jgi:hypothetical protein
MAVEIDGTNNARGVSFLFVFVKYIHTYPVGREKSSFRGLHIKIFCLVR